MYRKHIMVIVILIAGIYACNKGVDMQAGSFKGFVVPVNFPAPVYNFANNPVTQAGFALGKKLFNDPILSSNITISCADCHIQTSAFSHHGHSLSHGIFNRIGTRNAPGLINLAWYKTYMWDGGVFDLDLQPIAPITNHQEMDDTMANVLNKLNASTVYPALFEKAFGDGNITTANFLKALSQFMVMCISAEAKYDSVKRGQAIFTEAETKGYALFKTKCGSCHTEPLFTDNSFHNNGLSIGSINDQGRYLATLQDTDRYKFKTPTLRNLTFTQPYMHDGSLYNIESAIDHYRMDVQHTPNLDALLTQNNTTGIALSIPEKEQLIAFLKTLDDRNFLLDKTLAQ